MLYYLVNFTIKGGKIQGGETEQSKKREEEGDTESSSTATKPKDLQICLLIQGIVLLVLIKVVLIPTHSSWPTERAFIESCFKSFKWLEYSSKKNFAFCFDCHVFGQSQSALVNDGVSNCQKALSKFQKYRTFLLKNSHHKPLILESPIPEEQKDRFTQRCTLLCLFDSFLQCIYSEIP